MLRHLVRGSRRFENISLITLQYLKTSEKRILRFVMETYNSLLENVKDHLRYCQLINKVSTKLTVMSVTLH